MRVRNVAFLSWTTKKKLQEVAPSWPNFSQDSLHTCNESQRHWQGAWGLQCYTLDFSSVQQIIVELLKPRPLNLSFLWGKVMCCQSSMRQDSRFATQQYRRPQSVTHSKPHTASAVSSEGCSLWTVTYLLLWPLYATKKNITISNYNLLHKLPKSSTYST